MNTAITLIILLIFFLIPAPFVWWVRKKEIKIKEARLTAYVSDLKLIEKYETKTTAELLIERHNLRESTLRKPNEQVTFSAKNTEIEILIQAIDEVLWSRGLHVGKHYYK
ncbi:hypothetical protein [Pseudomonas sp. HUK17]|uniref:hypothetical protein n=1 Tax=Pseudomonas sp. HUK17 TaxID=1799359 RepID=UPI00128ED86B|nr:hypothetical protein [Pseudomonas sp. HUK17]